MNEMFNRQMYLESCKICHSNAPIDTDGLCEKCELAEYEAELNHCDICRESVQYCSCWRCMTCELLQSEDTEPNTDTNGEDICTECDNATPIMNQDGMCTQCGDYARDCPC